jgi:hypothetical protein
MVPTKMSGTTRWIEFNPEASKAFDVVDAIVSDERIAFDAKDGQYQYVVKLAPAPGEPVRWTGDWVGKLPTDGGGLVDVRRYDSKEGGVALVGVWKDGENVVDWITELRP